MSTVANLPNPRLLPGLRYRDVAAAIDWLCGAFGFKKHDVVTAVDGTILHARLLFGTEMILLLPLRNSDPSPPRPVQEVGNEMQSCYFAVDDADAHYRHAKEAGAEILELTEYEYGGRGYACRDPEGHIWNFVTHDPPRMEEAPPPPPPEAPSDRRKFVSDLRLRTAAGVKSIGGKVSRRMVVAAAASVAIVTVATAGWMLVPRWQSSPTGEEKSSKLSASLPPTADDAGQQAIERMRLNRRLLSRIHRKEPAPESAPQQAADSGSVNSAALAATAAPQPSDEKLNAGLASQPAAAPAAQHALRAARAAEQAPAERVLIPSPVRVETPKPAPKPSPEVREQQLARERAAKEYARARVSTAPAADATLPEANSPFWDCQTGPGGTVNCNPKKDAALEAGSPLTPKPKVTAAQPPNAPSARQPQARSPQLWDCQPQPPADEVVCRPIGAAP